VFFVYIFLNIVYKKFVKKALSWLMYDSAVIYEATKDLFQNIYMMSVCVH